MRLNLSLSDELGKKVADKAKSLGVSRTAFISMALNAYLAQLEATENLPLIYDTFEKLQNLVAGTTEVKK